MADVPATASDAYKHLIDGCAARVGPHHPDERAFRAALSPEQREVLDALLARARLGGVHDFLADLTWLIECHGLRLSYRGEPMPLDFSGMGLHGDLIGRATGWDWPEPPPTLPPWKP